MSQGTPTVRSAFEIKRSLLKRAFRENRGKEMISRILEVSRRIRQWAEEDKDALQFAREEDAYNEMCLQATGVSVPQALRRFNYERWKEGSDERLRYTPHLAENGAEDALEAGDSVTREEKGKSVYGREPSLALH